VYYHGVDCVTGFVLAGGESSRMGQDKAFMLLAGRTLLAHALERAQAATGNAWIVGSREKFAAFGPVVEDVYPGRGPLAGIQAALAAARTDLNLITAVDMPFLQLDFLNDLIARARASQAMVVVPRAGGRFQPLCAVYRKDFAEVAQQSLCAGKNKIDSLFAEVQTLTVEQADLERNGFTEEMFRNLNTEHDWQEATQKLSAR
jgi:molybdenum cofactor guanylyltransferase